MFPPEAMLVLIISVLAVLSSLSYAVLVARARCDVAAWWRVLIVGASLPLAGAGALLLAAQVEPLGASRSDLTLPVFRFAFVGASFLVAFVCSLVGAATFGIHAAPRRALEVALITAAVYLMCALALDLIPGFHVGGGDRAMPKVAALCNFVAGVVGGAVAFGVLTDR
jgi:hypothetical protein